MNIVAYYVKCNYVYKRFKLYIKKKVRIIKRKFNFKTLLKRYIRWFFFSLFKYFRYERFFLIYYNNR